MYQVKEAVMHRIIKNTSLGVALVAVSACGGTSTPIIVTGPPTGTVTTPAPGEDGVASLGFGDFTGIDKRAPNPVDGVRYVDAISSDGTVYDMEVFRIKGPTGSSNILYRGDGAYFHDITEEDEGNLSAGIGFRSDGTWLGGYMSRNGEDFSGPTSGSATFTGGYTGHIMEYSAISVSGDVTLNADFADGTISGAITNRNVPINPFGVDNVEYIRGDINLLASDITDLGGFGGTAGRLNGTSFQGSSGYYGGLFDADGDRAVGVLQVDHTNSVNGSPINITESGVFTVN